MSDPPPYPEADTNGDTDRRSDRGSTERRPRWVPIVITTVVVLLVVVMIALHLTGILGPGLH